MMSRVSHDQLRAARALLDLDQKDVAASSGLNVNVLSRIERGEVKPHEATREKLLNFYENIGVEFLEGEGVRRRKVLVRTYEGEEGIKQVVEQVYETARDKGGKISLFNSSPALFLKWLGEDWYAMHASRMRKLRRNIEFKIITREGECMFLASDFAQYRFFPKSKYKPRTIYAFGDKLAFFNFDEEDLTIVVIQQNEIVESFHIMFEIAWEHGAVEMKTR